MRVTIDPHKCQGTGYCEQLAGHIFQVTEGGTAQVAVSELAPGDLAVALEAAELCPTQAIAVETGVTGPPADEVS